MKEHAVGAVRLGGQVALLGPDLQWHGEPHLAKLCGAVIQSRDIKESDGIPAVVMLRKIESELGAEILYNI